MTKIYLISLALLLACNPKGEKTESQPKTEWLTSDLNFRAVADMNDCHFNLKKDGSFEFYRLLFDSIKNSSYTGTYTIAGDTLNLLFHNPEAEQILGPKALVNLEKNEITFFDSGVTNAKKIILQ